MFKDLTISREKMEQFHTLKAHRGDLGTLQKLNVMVLQRSAWPFAARNTDVDLPRWVRTSHLLEVVEFYSSVFYVKMQDDLSAYAEFYHTQFSGRKLDWDHSLGTVTLKAYFQGGNKELSVSLYQAVILLLFNHDVKLSYADIKAQTRLGARTL